MENQKSSTKSIMLNYGLILGFISILIAVVNFAFGDIYEPHWIFSTLGAVMLIALIIIGIKKVKENNGGYLKLGEALKTGLGIAVISGLVYVAYLFVFTSYIEPDFFTNMTNFQEQKILDDNPNLSDEQIEVAVGMMKKFMGLGSTIAMTLGASLFFGFIISLITGLIMKKAEEEV